jgi:hypothetical protein
METSASDRLATKNATFWKTSGEAAAFRVANCKLRANQIGNGNSLCRCRLREFPGPNAVMCDAEGLNVIPAGAQAAGGQAA